MNQTHKSPLNDDVDEHDVKIFHRSTAVTINFYYLAFTALIRAIHFDQDFGQIDN